MRVEQNIDRLKCQYDDFPAAVFGSASDHGPCKHYPRAFMGAYLRARFHQAVKIARRHGMAVTLYPRHEITDVMQVRGDTRLVVKRPPTGGRPEMVADAILLATGHWFSDSRQKNYFDSPWPANKLLKHISPGATVAVIGTSLSAIETVLTLTSDGRFISAAGGRPCYIPSNQPRRITLYSRSGLLPKVRGTVGAYVNRFLTPFALKQIRDQNDDRLTLAATFELLNSELEAIYGQSIDWMRVLEPAGSAVDQLNHHLKEAEIGDGPQGTLLWQTVLHQTFPHIREWYLKWTDKNRMRFDRYYTSAFFTHAATQPRINAAKLLTLLNAGLVSIVQLVRRYRFYRDDHQDRFCFDYTDRNGNKRVDTYRYGVNARGQPTTLTTDTSELAQNLIASINEQRAEGTADRSASLPQLEATGDRNPISGADRNSTIRIDPQTHRVVSPDFGPSSAVYAVGAMTRSQIIDTSMAKGIACSTATVADNLFHFLHRRR